MTASAAHSAALPNALPAPSRTHPRRRAALRLCAAAATSALLAPGARGGGPAPDAATLRVLCYNIHYGQGMDGRYDLERLAAVIAAAKPDLVALQEVDVGVRRSGRVHQARRLGELLGMAVRFGPTQHYQGGLYGNAVLSRLPVLDVAIHPLPYTEPTAERTTYPRGAIAVTVRTPGGAPLRFISTHFQHNLAADRVAEAQAVNALFAADGDTTAAVLAGDTNAEPGSAPMEVLAERWTGPADGADAPSAPADAPRVRIDHILFRPAGSGLRLLRTEVIDEPVASDHRPVLAVFALGR